MDIEQYQKEHLKAVIQSKRGGDAWHRRRGHRWMLAGEKLYCATNISEIWHIINWVLVAHTCNPCHSGGRDQEDHGLKSAQANILGDVILKNPITKKGWWSSSRCRSWVQAPAPHQKKKKKNVDFLGFFGITKAWNQGLVQALYYFRHDTALFSLVRFSGRVSCFCPCLT
jgi:hypothetical protein